MDLSPHTCYQALEARDARYDGRFFTCVKSTGIYCRPICPARLPRFENCLFVPTAAAAQEAGYRPCLRCRPESSPSSAAWGGTSACVTRALALIEEGALDSDSVDALASRLGLGARQLRRLFVKHLGASPIAVAQTRRVLLAKQLIHQTDLPLTDVALASGFGSVRRFNETFQRLYRRPPGALRRRRVAGEPGPDITLLLPYRPPYDWGAMLDFLALRAIPGVESVDRGSYRRTVRIGDDTGSISVTDAPAQQALRVSIRFSRLQALPLIIDRVRRMFDLKADPGVIRDALSLDPVLAPLVQARPGLRVPGGWDTFEIAVRAVLGQQVSVRAGIRLAGQLVECIGDPAHDGIPGGALSHHFPRPERFTPEAVAVLGMPRARIATLVHLATAYRERPALFERQPDLDRTIRQLGTLPGIGEWTAQYIALRALQENDAFLAADVGVQRALAGNGTRPTARQLLAHAERWRPWRAYAVMHLWLAEATHAERSPTRASIAPRLPEENRHAASA